MISRKLIKENAKAQLGNNIFGGTWLTALLVLLVESAIAGAVSAIPNVGIVLNSLVIGPLSVGVTAIFVNLMRFNTPIDIGDIFSGFKNNFGRNFLVALLTSIFTFLWLLLFIIPGIVKAYAYSMAFYIANDHPEYDWQTCINESKRLTAGHKGELFMLDLSFIGWYFIGTLCFGLGILWVAPYHQAAKINYFEALVAVDNGSFAPQNNI